jgi:hypothetical protein
MHRMKLHGQSSIAAIAALACALLAGAAAPAAAQSRTVIRAPGAAAPTTPPIELTEPAAAEQLPSVQPDPKTRIEQVRQGRRVTEIVVSPGGYSHRYVIENRDPGAARGPLEGSGNLSVPRFVRFSF